MRGLLLGFGLVLLCVGVIAVLGSQPPDTPPSGEASVERGPIQGEVRAVGRAFRPQRVTVLTGTTLTLRNTDDEAHGIRFEESGLRGLDRVDPRGADTVDVEADPGQYAFVCPLHPRMRGTLVVERASQ